MEESLEHEHNYISIYILAMLLFIAGKIKVFRDNVKNYALIYFSFITFLWASTSLTRYTRQKKVKPPKKETKKRLTITVPHSVKCFFGEKLCEEGDINIWTFGHFIIYFIAGILFPNRYLFFFALSILCEWYEHAVAGYNSKPIIDPVFNMAGYFVGNIVYHNKVKKHWWIH